MSVTEIDVNRIDWSTWKPTEYANLCFVMRGGQILLIRKKRGLGAGKINGPGGRLEKGETALESAIRETQEELGVTPTGLEHIGELFFQFCALFCSRLMRPGRISVLSLCRFLRTIRRRGRPLLRRRRLIRRSRLSFGAPKQMAATARPRLNWG